MLGACLIWAARSSGLGPGRAVFGVRCVRGLAGPACEKGECLLRGGVGFDGVGDDRQAGVGGGGGWFAGGVEGAGHWVGELFGGGGGGAGGVGGPPAAEN